MSTATLSDAVAELYALLQTSEVPTVSGVTAVYDHEPSSVEAPVSITIALDSWDEDWWMVALRIYVSVTADKKAGWDTLNAVVPAVDQVIRQGIGQGGCHFGPSRGQVEPTQTNDFLVATSVLTVGREDAF